jgi:hypothetical protein
MAFPRIEIYPRAHQPLTGDEDFVVSQGGVLRKTSTNSVAILAKAGIVPFGGPTVNPLPTGTAVGVGPTGALIECKASDGVNMPSFVGFFLDSETNDVRTQGIYTTTGLTAGSSYFIADDGGITVTAPTTLNYAIQRVGVAISSTELFLQPGIVVLSAGI